MAFKLLIIEKGEKKTESLESKLVDEGYEVEVVNSGEEGIEKLKQDSLVRLVLLDDELPDIKWQEFCSAADNYIGLNNLAIILMISSDSPEKKAEGLESGADDILVKPLHYPEVSARVNNLFNSQFYLQHLQDSYQSVNRVMLYSEQVVDEFDPFWFKFPSVQEELVEKMLSGSPGIMDPEVIMVGEVDSNGNWRGTTFEWSYSKGSVINYYFTLNVGTLIEYLKQTGKPCVYHKEEKNIDEEAWKSIPSDLKEYVNKDFKGFSAYYRNNLLVMMLNHPPGSGFIQVHNLKSLLSQLQLYQAIEQQSNDLREAFIYTARALSRAAEAIDSETGNHILRVGEFAHKLAIYFYSEERHLEEINYSAWMHDVGKMKIDPAILLKEGPLTKEEFREMEIHTVYGVVILGDSPYLETARQIALSHHERWDGTGYPYGLAGEEIPLPARLVTIADVYDALRSKRPYKPAFSHQKSCSIILEGDDRLQPKHFCPQALEAFRESMDEFDEIYERLL